MDLREVTGKDINRHPWEISRTKKILSICTEYFKHSSNSESHILLNVGAGDLFFDLNYLELFPNDIIYALDIGYRDLTSPCSNIIKISSTEQLPDDVLFDFILMMDSLEYMKDDKAYLEMLLRCSQPGATYIYTLPAYQFLFSDHDRHVENLRRYSHASFTGLVYALPNLEIVYSQYFYTCLFLVRLLKVAFHLPIDKNQKITACWKFHSKSIVTRFITCLLNFDYNICKMFRKIGLYIPGLSLLCIFREICASVPKERSAIPLETERSSAD